MPETKPELKKPEVRPIPETAPEAVPEVAREVKVEMMAVAKEKEQALPALPAPEPAPSPAEKDPVLLQIENLLAEDLIDVYANLPSEKKLAFKEKGEEVASKIKIMIESARVAAKEVLNLIISWLRLIPGVNKFFLEQEAKLKTDKILALAEQEKSKRI